MNQDLGNQLKIILIILLFIHCNKKESIEQVEKKSEAKIDYSTIEINDDFISKNELKIDYNECKIIQYFLKTKQDCIPTTSQEHFCNVLKNKIRKNQFYFIQEYIYYKTTRTDIEYIFKPDTTVYTIEYRIDKFAIYDRDYILKNAPVKAKGRIYFKDNNLVLENILGMGWQKINKKIDKIRCDIHKPIHTGYVPGFIQIEDNEIVLNLDKPYHQVSNVWLDLTKD